MSRTEELLQALLAGETVDFEPLTRFEAYLKNCCDGCGCEGLPTPNSRAEILLYQLAENLEGGGGESIDALTVSVTGECTATEVEDGYTAVTLAVPTKNYNNAEGVNF